MRDEKCFMSQPLDTETLFTLLPSYLSIFLDSKITIRVRQKKKIQTITRCWKNAASPPWIFKWHVFLLWFLFWLEFTHGGKAYDTKNPPKKRPASTKDKKKINSTLKSDARCAIWSQQVTLRLIPSYNLQIQGHTHLVNTRYWNIFLPTGNITINEIRTKKSGN